jgi:hypothetical protein
VTKTLARSGLRSALNPGHPTGYDGWLHSPIQSGPIQSGYSGTYPLGHPFQVDIIPVPMSAGKASSSRIRRYVPR